MFASFSRNKLKNINRNEYGTKHIALAKRHFQKRRGIATTNANSNNPNITHHLHANIGNHIEKHTEKIKVKPNNKTRENEAC